MQQTAESLGGDYVLSRKPNPANVTDPDVICREITETVEAAQKFGCPFDYSLKDISTVNYRPQNLMVWAEVVSDVLDGYYGREDCFGIFWNFINEKSPQTTDVPDFFVYLISESRHSDPLHAE